MSTAKRNKFTFFRKGRWTFALEFVSIFIAVISAFALNNWNDNRRAGVIQDRIIKEIRNGIRQDILDIKINRSGHTNGLAAVDYFRRASLNVEVAADSFAQYYFILVRDFISIQNRSGYESLKSIGVNLIEDDSVRQQIISLYEIDFATIKSLEEAYADNQFFEHYNAKFSALLSRSLTFTEDASVMSFTPPLKLTDQERSEFLLDLWRIELNRIFCIRQYDEVEASLVALAKLIDERY